MKTPMAFLFFALLFTSCAPTSNTDYVELTIPAELANQPEVVKRLEKDAKLLNYTLNSVEDALTVMVEIGEEIAAIEETTEKEDLKRVIAQKSEKLANAYGKMMLNGMWFLSHEFVKETGNEEIVRRLSEGEKVAFEKSVKHLRVKTGLGEQKLEEFGKRMDELTKIIEEKEAFLEEWSKKE